MQPSEFIPCSPSAQRSTRSAGHWILALLNWVLVSCNLRKQQPLDVRDYSRIVEQHTTRYGSLRTTLIDHFNKMEMVPMSVEHTHKAAAENRTSANVFMNETVRKAGYTPYNVSRSNHDIEGGSRYFYTVKDVITPFRDDEVTENSAFIFCDVDYYCDMNKWLSLGQPCILYTLVPQTLSHRAVDYAFHIKDDLVHYQVSGGAVYSHPLWKYEGDTHSVVTDDGDLIVYQVEQKIVPGDPHRRFIWFVPGARIAGPHWEHLYPDSTPCELERRTYTRDEFTNYIYEPIMDRLSIARNGEWQSVELSGRVFEAIRKRIENKSSPPVIADIERILRESDNGKTSVVDAPLLFQLVAGGPLVANIVRTTTQAAHFQPLGDLATEDGKHTGQVISNVLVENPSLFPTKGYNSDQATITGRIQRMTNTKTPTKNYKVWANEFVQLLVPDPGKGTPLSVEEVRLAQKTPNQRSRFELVKEHLRGTTDNRLKAFIKAEPYGSPNDPRNITTMSPENTIVFSTFAHAFKRHMKQFPWYGPGLSPKEVAQRLQMLSRATGSTLDGDYSRMDGTHSAFTNRHIVRPAYMRWCAPEHRAELNGHFKAVYRRRATTATGILYDPGETNRSGSSITTEVNTLVAAFNIYAAYRELGHTTTEAFALIGFVFGDDTNHCDDPGLAEALEKTASDLGLQLKIHRNPAGSPVPCLGRYFVDPATRLDSFQDPLRTLSKLHLSANKQVTPEQALVNKALGYANTDGMTPLIGTWALKVLSTHGKRPRGMTNEEVYKCSNAWPQSDKDAITTAMAHVLNLEVSELKRLDTLLQSASLDQMPVLLTSHAAPRIAAVVDDVVVGPATHIQNNHVPNQESERIGGSSSTPELQNRRSPPPPGHRPPGKRQGPRGPPRQVRLTKTARPRPLQEERAARMENGQRNDRTPNRPPRPTRRSRPAGCAPIRQV
uniref:RNA replicase n=1 Tax=Hubei noda-like virus 5 TaxID=1922985 RepID=A0A1L3KG68_9VIRU|nr:hypothetical protein [Hubei noda-like virus 5]APG76387.1 hypothetical protein [Hubei noda-like virus 5]